MSFMKRMAGVAALGGLLLGSGLVASEAQAGYVVTLKQVGPDVVATGSGPIDLTGLGQVGPGSALTLIAPFEAVILIGPPLLNSFIVHGFITGPTSFGHGDANVASTGNGDIVGVNGRFGELVVPVGYVSGDPLADSSTYPNQTFNSLEVTPGTYEWTWGIGPNQNFTLIIGAAAVPEPASLALLGMALVGLAAIRRRKRV